MEEILAMFLGALVLSTPIVYILTKHQQKMTAILHNVEGKRANPDISVQQEIATLKEIVNQQTITIDTLAKTQAQLQAALTSQTELSERVRA